MNYAKRIYYKIITPFRTVYRYFFRPITFGVKCLIEKDGKYLLVKINYGKKFWTLPGGGLKRGELPEDGARREVFEEVGIRLGNIDYIGFRKNNRNYLRDTVYFFKAETGEMEIKIDPNEVQEFGWFKKEDFPDLISPVTNEFFEELNRQD